jgi:hypothetical protein
MSKVQEAPPRTQEAETEELGGNWAESIAAGQANGLLPLLSERLEQGRTAAALEGLLTSIAPAMEVAPGLALKLERSLAEAYRGSRTPYRWVHLWASALALTLWPREGEPAEPPEGRDLRTPGGTATISTQG